MEAFSVTNPFKMEVLVFFSNYNYNNVIFHWQPQKLNGCFDKWLQTSRPEKIFRLNFNIDYLKMHYLIYFGSFIIINKKIKKYAIKLSFL